MYAFIYLTTPTLVRTPEKNEVDAPHLFLRRSDGGRRVDQHIWRCSYHHPVGKKGSMEFQGMEWSNIE